MVLRFLKTLDTESGLRAGIFAVVLMLSIIYVTRDIEVTYVFLGDQGHAATVLRQMHEGGEVPLLGPPAGFNGRYFGPAYYYLLYFPYLLFDFDPVAGGYFTAYFNLFSLAAFLFYLSLKQKRLLLPLSSFCAFVVCPGIFRELRTQWNPNLLPGILSLFLLSALCYRQVAYGIWRYLWGVVLGVVTGVALQLHTTAFPLLPALAYLFVHDALGRQLPLTRRFTPALVVLSSLLVVFLPTIIQGLQDDFQNLRLYFSFVQTNSQGAYGSWSSFIRLVVLASSPWCSAFGTYPGYLAYGLLVPISALSIHRKGWQNQESLLFGLISVIVVSFLLGLSNYRGQVLDYYWVLLTPVPFVFAAALPSVISTFRQRTAATICLCTVILLPIPSALAENSAYLTLRPDSYSHYNEALRITERIAADAAGRQFGIHFQDRKATDSSHYLYHFGTLSHKSGPPIRAERITGVGFYPLNYLVAKEGERLFVKVAPGVTPDLPLSSYSRTPLFREGSFSISRLEMRDSTASATSP